MVCYLQVLEFDIDYPVATKDYSKTKKKSKHGLLKGIGEIPLFAHWIQPGEELPAGKGRISFPTCRILKCFLYGTF